jgi:FlaG/FlaF family flagellin (archaellin)
MLGGIAVMIAAQLIGLSYGGTQHFERYVTSVVLMYAVGYPIGHTAVLGAFSKIQKSGPQAALMGWFATAGSLSRIIFPILSGYLDKAVKNSPFNVVLFVLSLSYMGIVMLKSQMRTYIEVDRDTKVSRVRQSEGDMSYQVRESTSGLCGRLHRMWRALSSLTRKEKTEVLTMILLMAFTILDIVNVSEESREGDGFTFDKDRGSGDR